MDNHQDNAYLQYDIRGTRNLLLIQSDWTQGKDIQSDISEPWANYRQLLRDITKTDEFINDPLNVIWPTKPENN